MKLSNKAITLTELVVALAFLSVVVLTASAVQMSADRFLFAENEEVRLANEASLLVERIAKDISLARPDNILQFFPTPPNVSQMLAFEIRNGGNLLAVCVRDAAIGDPCAGWNAYRFQGNDLEFSDDFDGCSTKTGNFSVISNNVVGENPMFTLIDTNGDGALNDNTINISLALRQDPLTPQSIDNVQVALETAVRIMTLPTQ